MLAAMSMGLSHPASAEDVEPSSWHPKVTSDTTSTTSDGAASKEIWSGAEGFRSTWAFYSGLTYAPGGLAQDGVRVRISAGMSTYAMTTELGKARAAQPFADVLGGYQWQLGPVTLKAFAGATGYADIRTAEEAIAPWSTAHVGPKVTLESWWAIDPKTWASFDVSYSAPQTFLWSRARYGLRVLPQVSLGAEGGMAGEAARIGGRIGAFARYEWEAGEVVASGGVAALAGTSAATESDARGPAPYLTLLWLQRF